MGWSREKLRHTGTREESRLSKKTTRQGRPGNPHRLPIARGSAKHFETLASSSAEKLYVLFIFILACTSFVNIPSTIYCIYPKTTIFPDVWIFIGCYFDESLLPESIVYKTGTMKTGTNNHHS